MLYKVFFDFFFAAAVIVAFVCVCLEKDEREKSATMVEVNGGGRF